MQHALFFALPNFGYHWPAFCESSFISPAVLSTHLHYYYIFIKPSSSKQFFSFIHILRPYGNGSRPDEKRVRIETRRVLSILEDVAAQPYAKIAVYDPDNEHSIDVYNGSQTAHFDRFYEEGGAQGIKMLTNFDPVQFQDV